MSTVTDKDLQELVEKTMTLLSKKYPLPDPDIFGNLITVVGKDGSIKTPPADTFRWTERPEPPEDLEAFRTEYMQQPFSNSTYTTAVEVKADAGEMVESMLKAKEMLERREEEMALTTFGNIDRELMAVKRLIPEPLQDVVLNFFTPDPMNYDREYVLMKSRQSGKEYMRDIVNTTKNLEELAKSLTEFINRSILSQGYKMDDDAYLPAELISMGPFIDNLCSAMENDEDFVRVNITTPLQAQPISGGIGLESAEEMMSFQAYSIPISDILYWIDRLAFQVRCERRIIIDRFKSICKKYIPDERQREFQEMSRSVQTLRRGMAAFGTSAADAAAGLKALGTASARVGIGKPEKVPASASAKAQRSVSKKRTEPTKPKERAIDL